MVCAMAQVLSTSGEAVVSLTLKVLLPTDYDAF
jgi:hypothetical protein